MGESSLTPTTLLAIYCGLVLLASLAGGWLLLALRLTHARLQTGVSFVSGLMLGWRCCISSPMPFTKTIRWTRPCGWPWAASW